MNYFKNFILGALLMFMSYPAIATSTCLSFESGSDRGLEIRYVKMEIKDKKDLPKEIKVEGVTYPLFETKEDAYNATLNSSIKRDITIVYVISSIEKNTEILSLEK